MILVTGATGLLGQHVLAELTASGKQVRALYRNTIPRLYTTINANLVTWVQGSILDLPSLEDAMQGVNQVYHVAAMVSYDPRLREAMHDVNVHGTAHVVNLCLEQASCKLVHVSSIATLGGGQEGAIMNEENRWQESEAHSAYAKSKYQSELEVWRGMAEGLDAVIVNPGIILGEGDTGRSSTNLIDIVRNEFPYYTAGSTGWVDAHDVAKAMHLLMESDRSEERFVLVANNRGYHDVFTLMAKYMHVKPPHRLAKPWMTELVWRWEYVKSTLLGKVATITEETARAAHEQRFYSGKKIETVLPEFSYQTLEQTIKRICTKA